MRERRLLVFLGKKKVAFLYLVIYEREGSLLVGLLLLERIFLFLFLFFVF